MLCILKIFGIRLFTMMDTPTSWKDPKFTLLHTSEGRLRHELQVFDMVHVDCTTSRPSMGTVLSPSCMLSEEVVCSCSMACAIAVVTSSIGDQQME
jgi:hypothetical protein